MNNVLRIPSFLLIVCLACGAVTRAQQGKPPAAQGRTASTPEQQFALGVAAQQHGRAEEAMRIYARLLKAHPDALPVRVNLAGLQVEAGRYAPAIELYRAGLRIDPTSKDLQLGLAYALGRQGTPEGLQLAAKALEMLHKVNPADEQISMLLADSYVRQGRYAEALPLAAALDRSHPADNDVQWLYGSALLGVNRTVEGLERIDALAVSTGSADAYLLAGRTRLDLQQYDLAKADAQAALAHDARLPGGLTLLGRALEHLGDYDGSVNALRTAAGLDDTDFDAHLYLGAVLLFQRKLPEAEQHLKRALVLQPGSAEARYKLALLEQGQARNDDAVADLHKVIVARPAWLEPRTTLVALLYKLHRPDEAAKEKEDADRLGAAQQPGAPQ